MSEDRIFFDTNKKVKLKDSFGWEMVLWLQKLWQFSENHNNFVVEKPLVKLKSNRNNLDKRESGPICQITEKRIWDHVFVKNVSYIRNFLYRDMKCGMICLSHAAQLPVLNGRKCSPTFNESSNISFNISYLGYY